MIENDRLPPQPWFFKGNRVKDANGMEVCFMSCDPSYVLNNEEKRVGKLIEVAPKLLEACKRISNASYGVAIGDLEFLREAIKEAESGY